MKSIIWIALCIAVGSCGIAFSQDPAGLATFGIVFGRFMGAPAGFIDSRPPTGTADLKRGTVP